MKIARNLLIRVEPYNIEQLIPASLEHVKKRELKSNATNIMKDEIPPLINEIRMIRAEMQAIDKV